MFDSTTSDTATAKTIEQHGERADAQECHKQYNGASGIFKMTDIEIQHS